MLSSSDMLLATFINYLLKTKYLIQEATDFTTEVIQYYKNVRIPHKTHGRPQTENPCSAWKSHQPHSVHSPFLWHILILSSHIKKQSSPTTRHEGAWGESSYSCYSFLTSALDGGEWSASRLGRALPQGKNPRYPLYRRLGGPQSRSGHRG
jgi:hypothetical protein